MLGSLRFVLAILVVMNHLWTLTANKVGANAVIGFYCISGFLMTRILCEVYVGRSGKVRYFANRIMRIFPCYLLIVALTVIGLALLPAAFGNISPAITLPKTPFDWFQNLTLVNLINAPLRLIPPAWSLSVEWVFYLILGIGVSIKLWSTLLWWLASLVYTLFLVGCGADFASRYTPPEAASLFFATGALAYHVLKNKPARPVGVSWWLLLGLFCVFPLLSEAVGWDPHLSGYYGAFAVFLFLFFRATTTIVSEHAKKVDKILGDLAYPVFLSHYFCSGITNAVAIPIIKSGSLLYCLSTLAICLVLSALLVRHLDPAVERVRSLIRPA